MPSIGAAKQALLLAQIMHTAAYSALNVARPLRPVQLPSLRPVQLPSLRPRQSQKLVLHAAAEAGARPATTPSPAPTGLRARLKKAASFKKGDLAKYGVSAFFAYGFVSKREQLPPPELHLGDLSAGEPGALAPRGRGGPREPADLAAPQEEVFSVLHGLLPLDRVDPETF